MNVHLDNKETVNEIPSRIDSETGKRAGPLGRAQLGGKVLRARRVAELLAAATISVGCAAKNYDFDRITGVEGHLQADRLSTDLTREREEGEHQELYDMGMVPLAHTHLDLFAEADEEGIPHGFVRTEIDAYLPLFGFVDATIQRYDEDRQMYEQHDFNSYLWGLFQSHEEQIETQVGLRERKTRRFLWFFPWRSSPTYKESTRVEAQNGLVARSQE